MKGIRAHLRNTLLSGTFAAAPLAVTGYLIYKVNQWTQLTIRGYTIPFLGVVIAAVAIYLLGLVINISLGKVLLRALDSLIMRIPMLKTLYTAWKQVSFTSDGGEGMFGKVVLVPDETGSMRTIGFTSGSCLTGTPDTMCVFVPNAPNPMQGKLYFVPRQQVQMTSLTSEEGFKMLLSTGNYIPDELAGAQKL